jgi:hypothetical protein
MKDIAVPLDPLVLTDDEVIPHLVALLKAAGINNFGRAIKMAQEYIGIFFSEEGITEGIVRSDKMLFPNLYFTDAIRVVSHLTKNEKLTQGCPVLIPLREKLGFTLWKLIAYKDRNNNFAIDILPEGVHI